MSHAVQRHKEKRESSVEDYEEEDNLKLNSSDIKRASEHIQHKLRKEKWVKRVDWCKEKAQALFWSALAIILVFEFKIFSQFFHSVNPYVRDSILICVGILSMILAYGGFYLPYIRRQRHDINVSHPQLIYIASALIMSVIVLQSVISQNSSFVGFWQVYGKYTIAIIPLLALGYMMSMHFLPDGLCGGVAFVLANIGIVVLQLYTDDTNYEKGN